MDGDDGREGARGRAGTAATGTRDRGAVVAPAVGTAVTAVADALETEDPAGAALAVEVDGEIAGAGAMGGAAVTDGGVTATRLAFARSAPDPLPGDANRWIMRRSAAVALAKMVDANATVCRRD
jgi:hypothetical protein